MPELYAALTGFLVVLTTILQSWYQTWKARKVAEQLAAKADTAIQATQQVEGLVNGQRTLLLAERDALRAENAALKALLAKGKDVPHDPAS